MQHDNPDSLNHTVMQLAIPALPNNIHHLFKVLSDDQLNNRQLAEVIHHYPSIAARLIALANSAWIAPLKPVTSLAAACSRLGLTTIRSTSIALSIASPFDSLRCPAFDVEQFWTTSMLVSEGADLLAWRIPALQLSVESRNTVRTAGLLHNLGLLWLAHTRPEETGLAFELCSNNQFITLQQAMQQCLDTDYCEAGGWLAHQWGLPEVLANTLRYHLDSSYHNSAWEIVALVGFAVKMVSELQKGSDQLPKGCSRLEALGVDRSVQENVFDRLGNKVSGMHELVKTLFV